MVSRSRAAELRAQEFESDLEEFPDERGEILVEAAAAWRRAGNDARATELLTEAIALGGDDRAFARAELAETHFDLGRDEDAWPQLDTIRIERPDSPMVYELVAELLEERGELKPSLRWFNLAAARLDDYAELHANAVLFGRRRVRRALGLTPDQLDDSVQEPDQALLQRPIRARRDPASDEKVLPFWPRGELEQAHRLWPELVEYSDSATYVEELEQSMREAASGGVGRVTLVPMDTARLTAFAADLGADPAAEEMFDACVDQTAAQGGTRSWPPGRNEPCWCGSGAKYKKCCGRPG